MKLIYTFMRIYLQFSRLSIKAALAGILSLLLASAVLAQQPVKTPPTNSAQKPISEEDEVLRVDTNLIQVDAIVKDKDGKIVPDLQKQDFEILENGQTKQVDYSSFISTTETREQVAAPHDKRLMPNEVRRTLVFIANNPVVEYGFMFPGTRVSPEIKSGTYSMRDRTLNASKITANFLHKFIDEQMENRDLVSIVDTEVSLGVLSSFTNDREVLRATVKQMCDNLKNYPIAKLRATTAGLDVQELVQQNLAVIATAQSAVEQLKKVPGRKVVVMISRMLLYNTNLDGTQVIKDRMKELISQANQAQITFYYISPVHLETEENGFDRLSHGGVQELAAKTGGRSIYNTNDASLAFKEILTENNGYYQLAYDPQETVNAQDERSINVRVKKAGLNVQARSSVYKKAAFSETYDTKENLLRLLRSPFGSNRINVDLSSAYQSLDKKKGRLASTLKIDSKYLEPTMLEDKTRQLKMDLALQLTGPDNKIVRQEIKNFTMKISDESWAAIQAEGLVYQFETETLQHGYYQINVVACAANSNQCGSASQFINAAQKKKD